MTSMPFKRKRNHTLAVLALASVALFNACRSDILIRLSTRIYPDGGVDRILEVRGRTSDHETPEDTDWMASKVGIRLARPDAWARVEESPGRLMAEGFFASVAAIPPLLTFATESGSRSDRLQTDLSIEERVVIRRWLYRERHADPYSAGEVQSALDALVELFVEAIDQELRREFGADFDTTGATTFLRGEGRGLASAILSVRRREATLENYAQRAALWEQVLSQYGMRTAPYDPDEFDFWDAQIPVVLVWLRDRVAASVSTTSQRILASELGFMPTDEDDSEVLEGVVERVWGDEEELFELAGPHLAALSGYYASDNSPRFRFHCRVRLPGVLLGTNGTPDGDTIVWTFRAEDLAFHDEILRAESAAVEHETLVHIGARREFDTIGLVQLVDLLWDRDPDGVLHGLLEAAKEEGSLAPLRDFDAIPDSYKERARELLELLDPEAEIPRTLG